MATQPLLEESKFRILCLRSPRFSLNNWQQFNSVPIIIVGSIPREGCFPSPGRWNLMPWDPVVEIILNIAELQRQESYEIGNLPESHWQKLSPWPNFGQVILSPLFNWASSLGRFFILLHLFVAKILLSQFSEKPPTLPSASILLVGLARIPLPYPWCLFLVVVCSLTSALCPSAENPQLPLLYLELRLIILPYRHGLDTYHNSAEKSPPYHFNSIMMVFPSAPWESLPLPRELGANWEKGPSSSKSSSPLLLHRPEPWGPTLSPRPPAPHAISHHILELLLWEAVLISALSIPTLIPALPPARPTATPSSTQHQRDVSKLRADHVTALLRAPRGCPTSPLGDRIQKPDGLCAPAPASQCPAAVNSLLRSPSQIFHAPLSHHSA